MYLERILSDQFSYFSSEIWQQWRKGPYHRPHWPGFTNHKMIAASKAVYTH